MTTILSIYKPWGLIAYDRRKQTAAGAILAGMILAALITVHIATGGLGHHGH